MSTGRWRLTALVTTFVFLLSSCSKAVNVPLSPEPKVKTGALYRIVTKDKRTFETRDLVLTEEDATFTSNQSQYSFRRDEIDQLVMIEPDGSRTLVAVAIIGAVVLTGLYFLAREFGRSIGGAGAN